MWAWQHPYFTGVYALLDAIVIQINELFSRCQPNNIMKFSSPIVMLVIGLMLGPSTSPLANARNAVETNSSATPAKAFPYDSLAQWREKSFVGNTRYELHDDAGMTVLKATAHNSASVLYRKHVIDLTSTPVLEWSWKIESIYADINELTKAGDDFPARLYVTAKTGALPWQTIAINYVWSSNQPIDSNWANPYTEKSIMVSVESGESKVGHWVNQRRNVAKDFKTLFNIDIKRLSGYAVMVDGDNSSQNGTAYFGNIEFVSN